MSTQEDFDAWQTFTPDVVDPFVQSNAQTVSHFNSTIIKQLYCNKMLFSLSFQHEKICLGHMTS